MPALRNISRYGQAVIFCLFFSLSGTAIPALDRPPADHRHALVASLIRGRLVGCRSHPPGAHDSEKIFSLETLEVFYKERNYEPAWTGRNGFADAEALTRAIRESRNDGLTPEYYHLGIIEGLLGRAYNPGEKASSVNPEALADLDLLLSDSFFTLARHLSAGCVNPVTLQPEWSLPPDADLAAVLTNALSEHCIAKTLREMTPGTPEYAALRKTLARYREMAWKGGQTPVPGGRLLKEGTISPRVPGVRERLIFLGDLDNLHPAAGDLFGRNLEQAVLRFQERHGLKADGIVGPSTIWSLNVPIVEREKQLIVNLERMRWSDRERPGRYLIVNIARFDLDVVEGGNVILSMKVVVGKPYLDTPVFGGRMTYLVLNPVWNIPHSIAKKEILPKVKKDPSYLREENITVLRGWGTDEEEIDPDSINWRSVTAGNLNFRFRQEPGRLNPLGRIKFMFPNKFNVYLHDTPARNLFSENVRTFSHGCIRIEKPLELAEYLLKADPNWTRENIVAAIEAGETQVVRLPHPLYVYIDYVTAWVDKDGSAEFRKDIYGRDAYLYEALTRKPLQ
jgi:L,D-transpeptidase YcbB